MDVDELVSRAKAGDAEAFGALYDVYAESVYRFALLRLRQPPDAEDVLQLVFLRMIESLPRYEQRGLPFGAWVFRIARNAVADVGRTRRATGVLEDAAEQRAEGEEPAELLVRQADVEAIRVALDELTPERRDVILYRFFAGLSHAEIGALLGKREGAVRAIQFRALQSLRRRLDDPSGSKGGTG